jgi:uncharacterized low-complexity protein
MENKKSILAGSLIAAAFGGFTNLNANETSLTAFSALGSGAEVRTAILGSASSNINAFELKCGAKDSTATKQGKGKDGKCGEGKCGEGKKKEGKTADAKTKDGKCGQGKCGEKKSK